MGQKTHPIAFRLKEKKGFSSFWFATKHEYGDLIGEDENIRRYLRKRSSCQAASKFLIRRMSGKVEVTIFSARPGLVIGKKGAEIDILKKDLAKLTGKDVWIEVQEVKRPDRNAKLVAENIAFQLKRRASFRRALKKALQQAVDAGAEGIRVQVSGRIGGAEIARTEWYKEKRIPLHTIRADIDYGTARAETTYGAIGVKVWINNGEEVKK
ncbi:MAG: 30S ribosomal protein S3 [Chlamydiales bacterium]